jgi:hypothetical protein
VASSRIPSSTATNLVERVRRLIVEAALVQATATYFTGETTRSSMLVFPRPG